MKTSQFNELRCESTCIDPKHTYTQKNKNLSYTHRPMHFATSHYLAVWKNFATLIVKADNACCVRAQRSTIVRIFFL